MKERATEGLQKGVNLRMLERCRNMRANKGGTEATKTVQLAMRIGQPGLDAQRCVLPRTAYLQKARA